MSSPILGIDLGTTNSVVAVADGTEVRALADTSGRRLVPSTVSFHPDGSILVGHEARDRRLVDAVNTVFSTKRLIGRPFSALEVKRSAERLPFVLEPTPTGGVQVKVRRGTYTLPEISAFILRHVRTMAEEALGVPCQRAVITVPANFNELQRSATQAAAKIAGLEVVRMINEPTAATLAYGLGKERQERVLVYDLGGGTFDVTVLELDHDALEVISTAGDTFLGGDDFDHLLAERMADACLRQHRFDPRSDVQTFERLRAAAEWAKCQLSTVPEVELSVEELFHESGGRPVNFVFQAKRAEFSQIVRPLIARTFDVVNDALRACGRRPKEIDTVVLVGGSTRIPLVMDMVGEYFGRAPRFERDPDLVVAQGAALQAFTLAGSRPMGARAPSGRMPVRAPARPAIPSPARPRDVLPRQPAFAPPEPVSRPFVPAEPQNRPRTDAGLGGRPGTDAGLGDDAGTALGRVTLRGRTDDRQARNIGEPDASPPNLRRSSATLPAREPTLRTENDPPRAEPRRAPTTPLPAVAVVRPVAVGVRAVTGRHQALNELDAVEARPEPSGAGPMPAPPEGDIRRRKATLQGALTSPMPAATGLGADAPFNLSSASFELDDAKLAAIEQGFEDEPTRVGKSPVQGDATPRPGDNPAWQPPRPAVATAPAFTATPPPAPSPAVAAPPPPPPPPPPPAPPQPPAFAPAAAPAARPLARAVPPSTFDVEPSTISRQTGARDISSWMPEPASSPAIPLPEMPEPALPQLHAAPAPQPASPAPYQPAIPMMQRRAPLLMDVTPLALGIETVGGFCQHVVSRNAPVPTEKTRVFATGVDDQASVEIRICQGDSNVYGENESLGVITLDALRRAKRGDVRIEVTFMLDPSGVLDVRATDLDTKRAQNTRIQLRGGIANRDVELLRQRQERELGGSA